MTMIFSSIIRFPRGDTLLKKWLVNMRRDHWTPSKYSTICSDHFVEECFDRTGQTTRLHSDAVPTQFSFPQHLMKVCTCTCNIFIPESSSCELE